MSDGKGSAGLSGGSGSTEPAPGKSPGRRPARAGFLLSQMGSHAGSLFAKRLAPLGLSPAQAGVLRLLAREPELNQRALAARLKAVPSRVVSLIDDLEGRGLVTRERRAQDRRSHVLRLTDEGEQVLVEIRRVAEAHEADLFGALSRSDRELLASLLQRLADAHSLDEQVHPGYRGEPPGA